MLHLYISFSEKFSEIESCKAKKKIRKKTVEPYQGISSSKPSSVGAGASGSVVSGAVVAGAAVTGHLPRNLNSTPLELYTYSLTLMFKDHFFNRRKIVFFV